MDILSDTIYKPNCQLVSFSNLEKIKCDVYFLLNLQ